ncbi:hypothetical protein B0H10DRAFT_1954544 [Mycena sp. CBHHK59/15]|nr:hypothetical protein B0H10DRAFT_1954544 [Mycena sp. CBHHK59/15]
MHIDRWSQIDETQEAIARIRMAIEKYDQQRYEDEQEEEPEVDEKAHTSQRTSLMTVLAMNSEFGSVKSNLKIFSLLALKLLTGFNLSNVRISRINPLRIGEVFGTSFAETPSSTAEPGSTASCSTRMATTDAPGMAFARLYALLCCTLELKCQFDVALVHQFRRSKWKPRTEWAGCQVHEEVKPYSLLLMDYVIRGALLTSATESGKENLHFFIDTSTLICSRRQVLQINTIVLSDQAVRRGQVLIRKFGFSDNQSEYFAKKFRGYAVDWRDNSEMLADAFCGILEHLKQIMDPRFQCIDPSLSI